MTDPSVLSTSPPHALVRDGPTKPKKKRMVVESIECNYVRPPPRAPGWRLLFQKKNKHQHQQQQAEIIPRVDAISLASSTNAQPQRLPDQFYRMNRSNSLLVHHQQQQQQQQLEQEEEAILAFSIVAPSSRADDDFSYTLNVPPDYGSNHKNHNESKKKDSNNEAHYYDLPNLDAASKNSSETSSSKLNVFHPVVSNKKATQSPLLFEERIPFVSPFQENDESETSSYVHHIMYVPGNEEQTNRGKPRIQKEDESEEDYGPQPLQAPGNDNHVVSTEKQRTMCPDTPQDMIRLLACCVFPASVLFWSQEYPNRYPPDLKATGPQHKPLPQHLPQNRSQQTPINPDYKQIALSPSNDFTLLTGTNTTRSEPPNELPRGKRSARWIPAVWWRRTSPSAKDEHHNGEEPIKEEILLPVEGMVIVATPTSMDDDEFPMDELWPEDENMCNCYPHAVLEEEATTQKQPTKPSNATRRPTPKSFQDDDGLIWTCLPCLYSLQAVTPVTTDRQEELEAHPNHQSPPASSKTQHPRAAPRELIDSKPSPIQPDKSDPPPPVTSIAIPTPVHAKQEEKSTGIPAFIWFCTNPFSSPTQIANDDKSVATRGSIPSQIWIQSFLEHPCGGGATAPTSSASQPTDERGLDGPISANNYDDDESKAPSLSWYHKICEKKGSLIIPDQEEEPDDEDENEEEDEEDDIIQRVAMEATPNIVESNEPIKATSTKLSDSKNEEATNAAKDNASLRCGGMFGRPLVLKKPVQSKENVVSTPPQTATVSRFETRLVPVTSIPETTMVVSSAASQSDHSEQVSLWDRVVCCAPLFSSDDLFWEDSGWEESDMRDMAKVAAATSAHKVPPKRLLRP